MDINRPERKEQKNRRRIVYAIAAVVTVGLATAGVARLEPAAPVVERSSIVIETVKRGPLLRQVRGTGSLVPVDVNWIAATTEARVARVVTQAGTVVGRDTLILQLTDPAQVQRALDARYVLEAGEADLKSLRNRLASEQLTQRAIAAKLKADLDQAILRAAADDELAANGVLPELTRRLSRNAADELRNRYELESQRLRINAVSMQSDVAAQEAKLAQLRAQSRLQEQQLASLEVRAGIEGVLQQVSVEVGQRVAPGTILAKVVQPTQLKAQLRIPETQARDVAHGQRAEIDTRNGLLRGHVIRIDPAAQNGSVTVDVGLDGPLSRGARPDLTVDGTIELERAADVLYVSRPVSVQEQSDGLVFRLDANGATRTRVRFGRSSVTAIEIVGGLREHDRVIISDMSAWDEVDRVQVQ
ncbi:MAG TPA: HlyD family efflux transporter periplasmic adaptor subunit [Thermoanaerobaculia bacterium]|nr:HlyD family efflux transporter periplasmic adaptor subunit [Thermoanaerobaculia bacterium]